VHELFSQLSHFDDHLPYHCPADFARTADAICRGDHSRRTSPKSSVEVVQDPELSKDDRPLWVSVEAFDLAVFEFEHVAARCVHLLTCGRQLAKGKLQRAIVGALQSQLHHNDIAIDIDAM
jgi:hypothetical protein